MKEEKNDPDLFEKQFTRWKLTRAARSRPTMVEIDGEAAAEWRRTVLMVVVSLGAVVGMIGLIAFILQNV